MLHALHYGYFKLILKPDHTRQQVWVTVCSRCTGNQIILPSADQTFAFSPQSERGNLRLQQIVFEPFGRNIQRVGKRRLVLDPCFDKPPSALWLSGIFTHFVLLLEKWSRKDHKRCNPKCAAVWSMCESQLQHQRPTQSAGRALQIGVANSCFEFIHSCDQMLNMFQNVIICLNYYDHLNFCTVGRENMSNEGRNDPSPYNCDRFSFSPGCLWRNWKNSLQFFSGILSFACRCK